MFRLLLFFFSLPFFAQTSFEKAEKQMQVKNYNEAKIIFQKIHKENPTHTATIEYLGDIAGIEKNWDTALDFYKLLKNILPKSANAHYKYGGVLGMKAKSVNKFKAMGMIDDIENAFLKASSLDSTHIESRWALVQFYLEIPAILGGSEKKAQKYANEIMQLSNNEGHLAKGYIDVYFKRYQQAEKNYKKAYYERKCAKTYQMLYDLYANQWKDNAKATILKKDFATIKE